MGDWTAVVDGWECVDCGYVHPGDIDIDAHTAHVCQLTIDSELGRVIPSRETDPETSHAAAKEIKIKANSQRARLLQAFAADDSGLGTGLTDDQAMMYAEGVNQLSCWWKRCSELREGGYIIPTGDTRAGSAGPQRIVSKITDKGRRWVKENLP